MEGADVSFMHAEVTWTGAESVKLVSLYMCYLTATTTTATTGPGVRNFTRGYEGVDWVQLLGEAAWRIMSRSLPLKAGTLCLSESGLRDLRYLNYYF
jgi:hypothetical protein